VNGWVDDSLRALVEVSVSLAPSKSSQLITVWIDTAFNGFLVFPQKLIDDLDLIQEAATEAVLADGSTVILESYVASIEWFGGIVRAQVIANDGKLPLLGTELLANHRLLVDYQHKNVTIS
jgi:clan AA aspartic protease